MSWNFGCDEQGKISMKDLRGLCDDLATLVNCPPVADRDALSNRLDIDLQGADVSMIRAGLLAIARARLRVEDFPINIVASDDKKSEVVMLFEDNKPDATDSRVETLDLNQTKQYSPTGKGYAITYRKDGALITVTVSTPANKIDSVTASALKMSNA
jgi:hypothetical protein